MTQLVTVQQAAANALAAWIASQLSAVAGLQVEAQWPDPDKKLAMPACTAVLIGKRKDEYTEPTNVNQVDSSPTTTITWRVAFCEQMMQLDVWASDAFMRDDMLARLDIALHAGLQSIGQTNADPVETELLLALGNGWTGWAGYMFEEPSIDDNPDDVRESVYRATLRGMSTFVLTIDAVSPLLANARIKQRLSENDLPTQALTSLSAITQVGGGPLITVSGTPLLPANAIVQMVLGGAVGVATFKYSLDNGTTWSATHTTAATYLLGSAGGDPGSSSPGTGITVAFPAGTYVLGTTYGFLAVAEGYGTATVAVDGTTTFALKQ